MLLALLGLTACGETPPAHVFEGDTFGTTWQVRLSAPVGAPDELREALQTTLDRIDAELSTWREDSTISAFNQVHSEDWFPLTPHFAAVLDGAQWAARETGGALDITLRPLSVAWGFQGDGTPQVPEVEELRALRRHVGMHRLERAADGQSLRKRDPRVEIDLSAVAKGYAVDVLADLLREAGVENFLVEIGGEVFARGARPDGDAWRVAVDTPDAEMAQSLTLSGLAVATSGDYRNFFEIDGRRYAHVLHPLTGRPPDNGTAAATVVAPTAMAADALATAFLVLKPDDALAAGDRLGVGVRLIRRVGEGYTVQQNKRFEDLVTPGDP